MSTITLQPTASLLKPALVLNRNWQPINVATVARALIMLWNDSAKIVDPIDYQLYDWSDWSQLVPDRDEPFIQSVRQRIRIPEVIALTKFDAMPTQTVTFSRRNVFKRDKMTCQYCGKQPAAKSSRLTTLFRVLKVERQLGRTAFWLASTAIRRRPTGLQLRHT